MTIRLFLKMAASLNHRLYLPPQPLVGPGQNVPVQAGKVLLDSVNEGGLCGIGTSIGACFKAQKSIKLRLGCLEAPFP